MVAPCMTASALSTLFFRLLSKSSPAISRGEESGVKGAELWRSSRPLTTKTPQRDYLCLLRFFQDIAHANRGSFPPSELMSQIIFYGRIWAPPKVCSGGW